MAYELTGKIKIIQDEQTFASGFSKREIVVTVEDGNYPQDINLEFLKEKTALLEKLAVGQEVKVSFDIRGREYNGRYFNNLVGWRIEATENENKDDDDGPPLTDDAVPPMPEEMEDDIPF